MAQDILLARQQETILDKLASYFSDDIRRLCTHEKLDADIAMADFLPVEWNQISLHSIRHLTRIDLVCHYHSAEHNNISNTEVYFNRTKNWLLAACPSPEIIPDLMLGCAGTLKTLHLSGFDITSLPSLAPLQRLTALSISKCRNLTQLAGLGELSQLTFLYLSECEELTELPGLENLTQLTFLDLSECKKLDDFSGLENLTQLTYLNLYGCRKLSKLCRLNNLTQLRFLNLSKCPMLSKLSGLDSLTQLTSLNLSGCICLTQLSGLENLTQLTSLNLRDCESLRRLSGLDKLTQLTDLNLSWCRNLTGLFGLDKLTHLTHLNLSWCRNFTEVSELENLTQLTSLDLSGCWDLPRLENLTQLTSLNLSGCEDLTHIPESIRNMKDLRKLYLCRLTLNELPDWLPEIAEHFTMGRIWSNGENKAVVSFKDTTIKGVDMSIFEQPYEMVVKWFEERKKGQTQALNEIKVIFLGDGEAGKTYTISRLMNNGGAPIDYEGVRTPGIAIKNHPCKFDNREFKVNYWDFGGQEIMHSMHRIFLTNRTMYVVLVSASDPNPNERAQYWLSNIQAFAPNAPVLLALNKIDIAPHVSIDTRSLKAEYSNLTQVVRLSSLTFDQGQFDREFRHVLLREIIRTGMLDVAWPKSWIEVKNRLESNEKKLIPVRKYEKICKECQVGDVQMELLHWFNDLGVSFCFRDNYQLKHQIILQPKWITNGLYIILFNHCRGVVNGMVPHESIHELLENAPDDPSIRCTDPTAEYEIPRDAEYVLGIMRKFELSFRANEDHEFIPMLCQDYPTMDVFQFEQDENVLELHMVFEYLPNNLLHRLMVKQYEELDKSNVWKSGARFVLPGTGLSAVVTMDGNTLRFYIAETDPMYPPKTYLSILKAHTDSIWKQMGLQAPECRLVYKVGSSRTEFYHEELTGALAAGHPSLYARSLKRNISIVDILRRFGLDEHARYEKPTRPNRDDNPLDAIELLEYIVHSCRNIQADPIYGSTGDRSGKEDMRNRRIRDDLKLRLEKTGYRISDQSQLGRSETGQSVGELDLFIEDSSGAPWTIIEALRIHNVNKTNWNDHLTKLLGGYNYAGMNFSYLVTYVDAHEDDFTKIWENYRGYINTYHPGKYSCDPDSYVDLNASQDLQYIRKAKCDYTCGCARVTVYHLFVMVKPQPPKISGK